MQASKSAFGHPHLIMPACSAIHRWICHRGAKTCSRPLVKNVVSSALGATVELWRTGQYLAQPFCGCLQELERPEQYFPSNGQISVCFISQLCKIGHLTRAAQGSRRPGPAGGQQHAGRSKHEPILVRKDTQDRASTAIIARARGSVPIGLSAGFYRRGLCTFRSKRTVGLF